MIKPNVLSEYALFSTVRIETSYSSGGNGVGTGFFYDIPLENDTELPMIITNKHVVNDALVGSFKLHESTGEDNNRAPSGAFINVKMNNFKDRWIYHPRAEVDLCAMPFQPLRSEAESKGKKVYNISLHRKLICSDADLESLILAEEVFMVGYPIGLWDETNNLPIMRRGNTASHPALDFNGEPQGVVDIATFPGSSGSPILILNQGMYVSKKGAVIGDNHNVLLGVLCKAPLYNVDGSIEIKEIPTKHEVVSSTPVPVHLGYYIKAKEILELSKHVVRKYLKATA